jgi:tRNA-splicing ligase RtcB
LIGATEKLDYVHNHHNFAWKENHFHQEFYVIRKGATPAFPGQRGFVGGSMGDDCVILQGNLLPSPGQEASLYSTVHGAGRLFSRRQAKDTIPQKEIDAWLADRGVLVFGGGKDESPQAYRRLNEVLNEQGQTIQITETLKPVVVCMAGPGV